MGNTAERKKKRAVEKNKKKLRELALKEVKLIKDAKSLAVDLTDEVTQKRKNVKAVWADPKKKVASLNFLADRNGCGYYRLIWPMEMLAVHAEVQPLNSFLHISEFQTLKMLNNIRFQRQAEESQLHMMKYYIQERRNIGYNYRIQYEIDDLVPEIDPSNEVAYNYFIKGGLINNHLEMLKLSDAMIVSTPNLKNVYSKNYGIDADKITVIENTLPKFLYNFPRRGKMKEFSATDKPRIFWSGSSSHIFKGGDCDHLVIVIRATIDKYQWVLQGCMPPELEDLKEKIEIHGWKTTYDLPNYQFHNCKPDMYVTSLKEGRFNSCKSDLKLLEASALGVPFLGTSFDKGDIYNEYSSPYDNTPAITLPNTSVEEWVAKIDETLSSEEIYLKQINAQYEYLNGRWMEDNLQAWYDSIHLGG